MVVRLIIGSVGNGDCDDHTDTRMSSSSAVFAKHDSKYLSLQGL